MAVELGEDLCQKLIETFPQGFYTPLSSPVKTMQLIKKHVVINGTPVFDIQALFNRLLVVGLKQNIHLSEMFQCVLGSAPGSVIDEHGNLRKGTKSALIPKINIKVTN